MSAPLRIGITGLGRIPRNLLRLLHDSQEFEIGALAVDAKPRQVRYLLRFDTLLGRAPYDVELTSNGLDLSDGNELRLCQEVAPGAVPWGEMGVEIVIECSAQRPTRDQLESHLEAGAERVLLCVPPADAPDLTVLRGLNHERLRPQHRIISCGSNTAHAVGPVLQALIEAFGVESAYMNTVHSYSEQDRLADVPAEDPRRGRAAAENIIPQGTNAVEVLIEAVPDLEGRLRAMAMNVPVPEGSVVDLVCWHETKVSPETVNRTLEEAASQRFPEVLGYIQEPIVSSDIVQDPRSGIVDGLATMTLGERLSKVLVWFDNGWGYAHRVLDLLRDLAEMEEMR